MSGTFFGKGSTDGFSAGRSSAGGFGAGWSGAGVWDAMDQLRGQFDRRFGTRVGRGDVRAAILALLIEEPMHGYQIIHEVEERSGGAWKPSPGSVYPTLQLLVDEGYVEAVESNGRKTYSLTAEGRRVAEAAASNAAPWEAQSAKDSARSSALPKAGFDLAQAAAQVGRSGRPEQVSQAVTVLEEARRKLYSILAQD